MIRGLGARGCVLGLSLALLMAMLGCGGGGLPASTTPPVVTLSITSPTTAQTVPLNGTLPITAAVTNAEPDLTWTVNGVTNGSSTYGTITGAYPTFTFTPPAAIPGGANPVTIVATQAGASQSASLTVTINPSATTPTAIKVMGGGANATGINLNLPVNSSLTLVLADVGSCVGGTCAASVTGIQVSRSGLATADCTNATCLMWLLGQGLTNSGGTTLASGLHVSVTHGTKTDVTAGNATALPPNSGFTDITFPIVVSESAELGIRDLVVTLGDGETQVYVGAIQIVN